ncbi:ArsR family transcriptional regulator [Candidatus Thorarchaeota archaeon]|nr:helix-turn-helix transcriptional regulator [Candidatus Thorarchaeota archaeon]TFG96137.1 MAG: ArsR family transcriptional regulator [Candidatus Thorarchaeota archaeon]
MTLFELLSDPVRARIYIEILVNQEMTAQELMKVVDVNRSTMSHHLTRFVEEDVLSVRVQSTGRPVKYYQINPHHNEEVVIKDDESEKSAKRRMFLESASAHLQVISNFILEHAEKSGEELAKSKKSKNRVTFTFHFMSKEESKIWEEEYQAFEKRFRERCKEVSSKSPSMDYIAFGGQVPTRKSV